jgi:hypothetical protein
MCSQRYDGHRTLQRGLHPPGARRVAPRSTCGSPCRRIAPKRSWTCCCAAERISVTTVPAAADVAFALTYGDGAQARGSLETLLLNLGMILLGGLVTLSVQRAAYVRRRADHRRRTA